MSFFKKTTPIRLAVVGNASSGKSFLLKDIIDALRSMGCSFFASDSGTVSSTSPSATMRPTRKVAVAVLRSMPAVTRTTTGNA